MAEFKKLFNEQFIEAVNSELLEESIGTVKKQNILPMKIYQLS